MLRYNECFTGSENMMIVICQGASLSKTKSNYNIIYTHCPPLPPKKKKSNTHCLIITQTFRTRFSITLIPINISARPSHNYRTCKLSNLHQPHVVYIIKKKKKERNFTADLSGKIMTLVLWRLGCMEHGPNLLCPVITESGLVVKKGDFVSSCLRWLKGYLIQ